MKRETWISTGAIYLLAACHGGGGAESPDVHVVARGSLTVEVTERAEIRPVHSVRIHSELPGRATIIYLIPEGSVVETGHKLVEFDDSVLTDRRLQQDIVVTRAEAARKVADEKLTVLRDELGEAHPDVVLAEAELQAKQKLHDLEHARLQKLEAQLAHTVIRAPAPGLVVYASPRRAGSRDVIEEGASVRERQALIELPDLSRMNAVLQVHESAIDKVSVGQPATIRVDAFAEAGFSGTVREIAAVGAGAAAQTYATVVEIAGENRGLKPGMSASVSIRVAELTDVLSVPLETVHRDDASTFVWLDTPNGPTKRDVQVGHADDRFAEIVAGVAEGDRVCLRPPVD